MANDLELRRGTPISQDDPRPVGLPAGVGDDLVLRVQAIDFVRGVAMILMAIDHVRVYAGVPAGGPLPGVFFTRWVTHFVAPAFVFLAGTAALLHARKLPGRGALARFLLIRGAWLILLELIVIRVMWTFNLDFGNYMLAGVIWMIGCCMMLLAGAIYLPMTAIATLAIAIIALHNLTDLGLGPSGNGEPHWLLQFLYFGGAVQIGPSGPPLLILFVIVPWIGVMMAGYAYGGLIERARTIDPGGAVERRRALAIRLGIVLTALFIVLRLADVYGDPRPWSTSRLPGLLAFLNTTKYPASLSFLLMTLGPMFLLLGYAERWRGRLVDAVATFGRVPMLYYLLHIPVIHLAACVVSLLREGRVNPWLFGNHPMAPPPVPDGYMWSLGLLYLVFAVCVGLLYFPCRAFARLRARSREPWLSYL
jgi:uncharacterized membrane protein